MKLEATLVVSLENKKELKASYKVGYNTINRNRAQRRKVKEGEASNCPLNILILK